MTIVQPSNLSDSLPARLARVMGKVQRIRKEGFNDFHKFKFVTDEQVLDLVRPLLADEGISVFPSIESVEQTEMTRSNGKTYYHTVVCFKFTLAIETGEVMSCIWYGESDNDQDKGIAQAATLAQKYWLLKLLMISSGEKGDDPDTFGHDGGSRRSTPRRICGERPVSVTKTKVNDRCGPCHNRIRRRQRLHVNQRNRSGSEAAD